MENGGLCGCEITRVHAACSKCPVGRSGTTAIPRPLEVVDGKICAKHGDRMKQVDGRSG